MQINPHCTKISFKTIQETALLCITAIALVVAFSSCSTDDIEMPMKTEISSEFFMKKNDLIPMNDSIPHILEWIIDLPKGTLPLPTPRS